MRKSFVASVAIVVAVAISTPVAAAPRHRDRTQPPAIKYVLKLVQKAFGIKTTADPTVPIPGPTADPTVPIPGPVTDDRP